MFVDIENAILGLNFKKLKNTQNEIVYYNINDPCSQISLFKDAYHGLGFSFPLNNRKFNYKTYFTDIHKYKKYIWEKLNYINLNK